MRVVLFIFGAYTLPFSWKILLLQPKTIYNMEVENPFQTSSAEPFVRKDGDLSPLYSRLYKTSNIVILISLQGQARITLDLQEYTLVSNTVIFLLPDSIISLTNASNDFRVSYFACSDDLFRESSFRFTPQFFHFIKENPCKILLPEHTALIKGLMTATAAINADQANCFRYDIAKNLLQIFLMDLYDKIYRWFSTLDIEGHNRQDKLFRKFMSLIHAHCPSEREVSFYAGKLCISTKYLTDICHAIIGKSAKKIIDYFTILEIKVLLQNTELSIQTISDRLNFPDQSYLGRFFKRHENSSPAEYRNKFIHTQKNDA